MKKKKKMKQVASVERKEAPLTKKKRCKRFLVVKKKKGQVYRERLCKYSLTCAGQGRPGSSCKVKT